MRINNYQGTVTDRPIDAVVIEPEARLTPPPPPLPPPEENFMDKVLSQLNSQQNIIPAGNIPVYDKG